MVSRASWSVTIWTCVNKLSSHFMRPLSQRALHVQRSNMTFERKWTSWHEAGGRQVCHWSLSYNALLRSWGVTYHPYFSSILVSMGLRIGVLCAKSFNRSRHVGLTSPLKWLTIIQMIQEAMCIGHVGHECAKYFTSPTKRKHLGYDLRVHHCIPCHLVGVAWRPWSSIRCPRQSMSDDIDPVWINWYTVDVSWG